MVRTHNDPNGLGIVVSRLVVSEKSTLTSIGYAVMLYSEFIVVLANSNGIDSWKVKNTRGL